MTARRAVEGKMKWIAEKVAVDEGAVVEFILLKLYG